MAYIEDKVKEIIADKLDRQPHEVTNESTLTSLGSDSLDSVEIIMEMEREFDFRIPDEDAEKLLTVEDMITYIGNQKPKLK